ncbi:fungal-specific transcription factor domain-containing protein [Xylogone sp. PMI_703]|nr:fungal-specific transcription factor domain-containing protein [Xylogone sp. PMI_703]
MERESELGVGVNGAGEAFKRKHSKIRHNTQVQSWGSGRKNISRACDLCKTKKIRCSGSQPCARCLQHRLTCEYNLPHLRGRHTEPLSHPRNPPTIITGVDDNYHLVEKDSPFLTNSTVPVEISSRHSPSRGVINNDSQYLGPTAGETFISRAWRRIRHDHLMTRTSSNSTNLLSPVINSNEPSDETFTPTPIVTPEITRQKALELIQFYFDIAVVSYRFLNRKLTTGWIDNDLEARCSTALDCHWQNLGPYKSSILFMMFATSLHYQEVSGQAGETTGGRMSKVFFAAGKQSLKRQRDHHRLETIQARLAYSIYLLANSKLEASWYVLGRTVQILTALGMHRAGYEHPSSCSTEVQLGRRCFWTAFVLDRYVSIILGRPRLIFDDLFDQPFPERTDDDKPELIVNEWAASSKFGLNSLKASMTDCSMDAPYFMYKLAQIMGEISFGIYPLKGVAKDAQSENAKRLTTKIMELWEELPLSLGAIHPDSLSTGLRLRTIELRISSNHAIVLANRPFLLGRSDAERLGSGQISNIYNDNTQRSVYAARTVVDLWGMVAEETSVFGTYWVMHHAVFSAVSVIYLYIILNSRWGYELGQRISVSDEDFFLLAQRGQQQLANAAAANRMCIRYCSILEELREEATKRIATSTEIAPLHLVREHAAMEEPSRDDAGPRPELEIMDIVPEEQMRPTVLSAEGTEEFIGDWYMFDSLISFNPDNISPEIM